MSGERRPGILLRDCDSNSFGGKDLPVDLSSSSHERALAALLTRSATALHRISVPSAARFPGRLWT